MHETAGIYVFGGITFDSEIALPELPAQGKGTASRVPVIIRAAEVCEPWPGAIALDSDCFATADKYLLRIPGLASYQVTNGTEIVVNIAPGADLLDVRAYLLGLVFVVLCQQRGLLPLHGSAVSGRDGVTAFLGRSGQGKSSLAAHLAKRGFGVIADDICLIDPAGAEVKVTPAAPWLKLWRNSLNHLGHSADGLERVFSEEDKYRLPLLEEERPQALRSVFVLGPDDPSLLVTAIEEISRPEAIPLLMNLTHQAHLLEVTGQREQSFLRCGRVVSQARAYRLRRPWGLERLESTVDAVQQFLVSRAEGNWRAR